jgi:hypothetical protein
VYELAAIIALAPPEDDACDNTRLGIADARIQAGLCYQGRFLYEHMLVPKRID